MSDTKREREFHFTDDDFSFISKTIGEKVGIVLKDHKKDMVYSRVARRLRALGFKKVSEYIHYIQQPENVSEVTDFVNAITTNLTRFYREDHHFEHLSQVLNSADSQTSGKKRYRIWSAGCSAGMEAYTIAITACESLPRIDTAFDFKILATDIDTNMIKRGSEGIYSGADLEPVPAELKERYLKKVSGSQDDYILDKKLRDMVSFKQLNLLENWPMKGPFDVVFCRNVVIYFNKETQRELFAKMSKMIPLGGWLYLGHSESLSGISDDFELIGRTIYKKVR